MQDQYERFLGDAPDPIPPRITAQNAPLFRPSPPSEPATPTAATTILPLAQSSRILVHSGFWNLLASTGSRFLGPAGASATARPTESGDQTPPLTPVFDKSGGIAGNQAARPQPKRFSVDMIGRPQSFKHPVHASDAEQAQALLLRWHVDRQGKVGSPSWAAPIKAAVRARQDWRDVDETPAAWAPLAVTQPMDIPKTPELRPALSFDTAVAVENARLKGSESHLEDRESVVDFGGADPPFSRPQVEGELLHTSGRPSLLTVEKAAAVKIHFEAKYHGILRQTPTRERSRALFEEALAQLKISDSAREHARAAWQAGQTQYLRDLRERTGVNSFVKLKTIGHGAFGVVTLVRERRSGELYAIKQVRKADMLRKGQEGHIRAERDLLAAASASTRWIVKMAYSFQDVDYLYLVLDYMPGGDLLTLLIDRDTFPEGMARFYAAEMVLAIEETHRVLGAIHRDIKPDNWLFTASGHLVISDFGLATDFRFDHDGDFFSEQRRALLYKHGLDLETGNRGHQGEAGRFDARSRPGEEDVPASILTWRDMQRRKRAFSLVGTNNYMPVEVLRGAGYDCRADWWSLGVIVYEMLYGYPPFLSKNRQDTRREILDWPRHLRFPSKPRISREAQDFITALLCEPEDRLGSRPSPNRPNSTVLRQRTSTILPAGAEPQSVADDGSEAIKAHAWFRGIDWEHLHEQTPPFQPQLSSKEDTRYFDDDIPDEPLATPEIAPGVPAPENVRDPMLRHPTEGGRILETRKRLAFQGWTFKKQNNPVYDPRDGWRQDIFGRADPNGTYRGRATRRSEGAGSSMLRSLSV
ncbi:hypothetical protein JCM8202v2_003194 [Rhodotorula sphaerocarpa]